MGLTAVLYDRDLGDPLVKVANILGSRGEQLQFGTQMPGGFATASYLWKCGWVEAWDYYEERYFYRLCIYDGQDVVWEGRLEDVEMSPSGISLTFMGYYRNTFDRPFNEIDDYASGTHYADEIIEDMLIAKCAQIHPDYSNIGNPGLNLAPITFTDNAYPGDHIQHMGEIGDGEFNVPWYFAVWEDRKPHFKRKRTDFSQPDWFIHKQDLADESGYSLRRSVRDLWNKIAVVYNTYDGMRVITSYEEDTTSQDKWDITREKVFTMGEGGTDTAAATRSAYLKDHKDPQQEATIIITNKVRDSNGLTKDLWHVRAGDVLRIVDLIPEEIMVENPQLDALRTFYVRETSFSLDDYTLTLTPDFFQRSAAHMLALADLGSRW